MQTSWRDNSAGPVSARESLTKTITVGVGRLASCREPILREVKDELKKSVERKLITSRLSTAASSAYVGVRRSLSTKPWTSIFFCAFPEVQFPEDANRNCAEVHRDSFLGSVADDRISDWSRIRSMDAARRSYHAFGHVLESWLSATICIFVRKLVDCFVGWSGLNCGRYYCGSYCGRVESFRVCCLWVWQVWNINLISIHFRNDRKSILNFQAK